MKQAFLFLIAVPLVAQSTDSLNSALWQQSSVEYRGVNLQAWQSARQNLPKALKDKRWTAALEQRDMNPKQLKKLPPAIVVDVDETIVDNSPSQKRFYEHGNGRFDPKIWAAWTAEAKARALPGAAEFLREARAHGVTIFYVTNRDKAEEEGTRRNLNEQGFEVRDLPNLPDLGDTLLLRGERDGWTSDKSTRRAAVAKHYRILMVGGDDLNDFFPAKVSLEERRQRASEFNAWWGVRWIILPNPSYGSWEDSILGYQYNLSPAEVSKRKLDALKDQ